MKVLPMRAELSHAGGRTDRHTQADMTKLSLFAILRKRL